MNRKGNKKYKETSSLLDFFKVGDRVKQIYYDNTSSQREYYGIVIGVKQHCMVVQWDTIDGEPNFNDFYSIPHIYEIFNGDEYCSPIYKEEI